MKRSKIVRVQGRKRNFGRSGALWGLECLEPRVLLSTVTVSPVLAAEGNTTTTATLTARLDAASRSNIILQYSTHDATAKGGIDYTPTTSSVVIPAGATSATFNIPILANNVYQGQTYFLVNMSVNAGNKLAQRQTAVSITDNDAPPSVGIDDVAVAVANEAQTVNVPVTLSSASSLPVTVTYITYNGTAVAGKDYQATSGKITFAPGQTFKTIPVRVMSGAADDTAFDVLLGTATNASLASSWVYGRVAIQEGAAAAKPTVTVSSAVVDAGGFEEFHVSLSKATTENVSFRYHSYAPTSGGGTIAAADGILTIPAGSTTGTILVRTYAGSGSADASFALGLTAPANANLASGAAWGKIISAPPSISVSDVSMLEGNSGTSNMVFTVTLSRASTDTVTVDYATADIHVVGADPGSAGDDPVAGSPFPFAQAGLDYIATSGTLTFAPGETSKTVSVAVIGDTTIEPNEPFDLNLSGATNATIARATAVGTILNDDFPSLSIAPASVTEVAGNITTQTLTYTVTLSSAAPFAVTVHYATTNGTAAAGTDYTATSGTLTFAPGDTSKTIDVTVTGNASQAAETFNMTLSTATNATIGTAVGVGTINYEDVLSDNLANASIGSLGVNEAQWLAANFSTGSTAEDLQSVTVSLQQFVAGTLTMKIYSDNAGIPGTVVGTLTSPGSFSTSSLANATFTGSGIALAANTTYWVALESSDGDYGWSYTLSNSGTGSGFLGGKAVTHSGDSGWATTEVTPQLQVIA